MATGKDLKAIIRITRFDVDERRRALGVLLRREAEIEDGLKALAEELERERAIAAADQGQAGFAFGPYLRRYHLRREEAEAALAHVRVLIAKAQDDLAEAFRGLKTYEIAQANRERREREEAARRDQALTDEIGMTLFRRRQAQDGQD